jgi:hypothetical protein
VTIGGVPRRWNFSLAAVSFPIIDIDFLRCHGLLVDRANLHLLPGELPVAAVDLAADPGAPAAQPRSYTEAVKGTSCSTPGSISFSGAVQLVPPAASLAGAPPPLPAVSSAASSRPPQASDRAGNLCSRFPAAFSANPAVSRLLPPHGVQHVISTVGSRPPPDSAAWTPPGWRHPRRNFRLCSTGHYSPLLQPVE